MMARSEIASIAACAHASCLSRFSVFRSQPLRAHFEHEQWTPSAKGEEEAMAVAMADASAAADAAAAAAGGGGGGGGGKAEGGYGGGYGYGGQREEEREKEREKERKERRSKKLRVVGWKQGREQFEAWCVYLHVHVYMFMYTCVCVCVCYRRVYLLPISDFHLYNRSYKHTNTLSNTHDHRCEGRTGYPLVDAAMRQLWLMGWLPNYMRHVVAGFLIEFLHIDWRMGERWFHDTLVDADVAIQGYMWQVQCVVRSVQCEVQGMCSMCA